MTKKLITITSMAILLIMAISLASCENRDNAPIGTEVIITGKIGVMPPYSIPDIPTTLIDRSVIVNDTAVFLPRKNGSISAADYYLFQRDRYVIGDIITIRGRYYRRDRRANRNWIYDLEVIEILENNLIGTEVLIIGKLDWIGLRFFPRASDQCFVNIGVPTIVNDTAAFVLRKNQSTHRVPFLLIERGHTTGDMITIRGKYYRTIKWNNEWLYNLEIIEFID